MRFILAFLLLFGRFEAKADLTYEQWQQIAPFLLPDRHPVKEKLDEIFLNARASASIQSLETAGFHIKTKGHWSNTIIAKHPSLHGFYIKLFTDDQDGVDDIAKLTGRIKGALLASAIIKNNHFESIFKVPRKWLYKLPDSENGKHVILIAEDMDVLSGGRNTNKWKSKSMNKKTVEAIYILITQGGFNDSVYPFNLPYSKDGRIAIIDTEKYNGWPIPYHKLANYFSDPMRDYWNSLTQVP